jgi:hypothetical protein
MEISLPAINRPRTTAALQDPALARGFLDSVDGRKWPRAAAINGGCLAMKIGRQHSGGQFEQMAVAVRPTAAGGTIEMRAAKLP